MELWNFALSFILSTMFQIQITLTEDGDFMSVVKLEKYLESDADGDKTPIDNNEIW